MLQSLRIRNLALLEELELDFDPGFTAVTGETGAGKSILLGALGLLAGERADKTIIRQGAAACEVEASLYFRDSRKIEDLLRSLDLPACEEGQLVLKRSLPRERPQKITVNGGLATLSSLLLLGEQWIDFHGPSEPRRLLKDSCQLELLDLYGRAAPTMQTYCNRYQSWRKLQAERDRVASQTRLSADDIEFLKGRLAKLDALNLSEESIAALERDFQRMSKAQELTAFAGTLENGLAGEDGATARVASLVREALRLEDIDPASKALADALVRAAIELADLAAEFSSLGRELHFDSAEAKDLEERMNAWLEATRRHGKSAREVIDARNEMRRRLAEQGDVQGTLDRLDQGIAKAQELLRETAMALRTVREKTAKELAGVASKAIGELGFKRADFRIAIRDLGELGPSGDCACEFLFSPNVGEAPLPLSRIASSGELARVMLALKAVLADLDAVPVLVFDEVDANVGGEIGTIVGEKMATIAARHQVLCVTHLPQVAACAANHLVVTKDQSGDRAVVAIAPIHSSRKARVSELARMLGDRSAKSALAHAEELLRAG